jgi:sn-glycerol 3-phosphate transport system permease protein
VTRTLETAAAWLLALLWALPLAYAIWTAFHPAEFSARFVLTAPLTLANFVNAWEAAPFARYFLNTVMLVTLILARSLFCAPLPHTRSPATSFPGATWRSRSCWCS